MNFLKGINVKYTEKQFYRKFSYKICFKVDTSDLTTSENRQVLYGDPNFNKVNIRRRELFRIVIDNLPDDLECKFRTEHDRISLFLDDEKVFMDAVKNLGYCISEVSMPCNEKHKETIESNHRIRVRERLFMNKYRFKVNIKNEWNNWFTDFENLRIWLGNLENPTGDRWLANHPLNRKFILFEHGLLSRTPFYQDSLSVYLNDEQDVMMLQMWLHNHYDSAEKAVLISEL